MVDIVHSIQQCLSQFVVLLSKQFHTSCHFNHLLVIIIGVCQDHYSKCDVNILVIELPLRIQYLPNGSPIPPKSVSFRFGWMNCNPFDIAIVCGLQGHSLGIEPHFLQYFCLILLNLCNKFLMPGNGRVTFDGALPNISVATTLWLPQVHHFYSLPKVDQVATLQHHFCWSALLPMYSLLRLL
jgi:hypothetical protein